MKSKKVLAAVLTAMLLTTSALAGCGSKNKETSSQGGQTTATQTTAEAAIDKDQTVNLIGYDPVSLDPSRVSDTPTFTIMTQVYEGLMREVQKDGKTVNELAGAEKMEKSADGLVYTFKLRDVKWTDGKTVTAKDYEFSWKRLCDKKVSEDYVGFLNEIGVKGAKADGNDNLDEIGVKAIDDKTFQVTLASPSPVFESAVSFKGLVPQREDKVKELGDKYGQDYTKMVFNGAFTIAEYSKGSKIVFKKNPNYWDAKNVKLETANCPIITEQATLAKMFEAKELDQFGATGDNIAKFKKGADSKQWLYIPDSDTASYYYVFNTKNAVLKNNKVRLAFSLGFDRQAELDTVYKRMIPAFGIVPAKLMVGSTEYRKAFPEPLKDLKDDPKKLLADGLKELNADPDASKINVRLLMGQSTSTTTALGQFLQNQWQKNLGVKVELVFTPDSPSYFTQRTKGDFDICAGGWGPDYNDIISYFNLFTTGNGNNNGKYSNPKYDDLVKKAMTEMDQTKRLDYFKQAEKLLLVDDAAVASNYYADRQTFRQNWLKGLYIPLFGGYYDLKGVYVQGKQ